MQAAPRGQGGEPLALGMNDQLAHTLVPEHVVRDSTETRDLYGISYLDIVPLD